MSVTVERAVVIDDSVSWAAPDVDLGCAIGADAGSVPHDGLSFHHLYTTKGTNRNTGLVLALTFDD